MLKDNLYHVNELLTRIQRTHRLKSYNHILRLHQSKGDIWNEWSSLHSNSQINASIHCENLTVKALQENKLTQACNITSAWVGRENEKKIV